MSNSKKKSSSALKKFMGAGIQMALIICLGIFTGKTLDVYLEQEKTFTIIFTLGALFLAIGFFIIKALKITNDDA